MVSGGSLPPSGLVLRLSLTGDERWCLFAVGETAKRSRCYRQPAQVSRKDAPDVTETK